MKKSSDHPDSAKQESVNLYLQPCACGAQGLSFENEEGCGAKDYLSVEEDTILSSMRKIRDRVQTLRAELKQCKSSENSVERCTNLEAMIKTYRDLFYSYRAVLFEANRRKHIRLGHLEG